MRRRKLSASRSRSELIASHAYAVTQEDRDKAASSGAAMPDGSFPITECEGDSGSVDSAIGLAKTDAQRAHIITRAKSLGCSAKIPDTWNADGSLKDSANAARLAIAPTDASTTGDGYEPKPYHADPDETVKCPSCERMNSEDAAFCDQCGFELKGADDVVVGPAATEEKPVTAAAGPPAPETNAVDAKGDVNPDAKCANPDCGHLASSHLNLDSGGKNTGPCSMANCDCLGMQVQAEPNDGPEKDQPKVAPEKLAAELADMPATPVGGSPEPSADLNAPPPMEGGESMGPAFTIVRGIIEGQPTGDGRQIAPEALTWRTPPLPLMGLDTETHDPMGFDQNDPAVICGRIDSLERAPGEGATQIISARGFFLPNDDGMHFAELTEAMGRIGVSADVAVQASEIDVTDVDPTGFPTDMSETLTDGTIRGFTVCPYPAFEGAYLVLGDGTEPPDAQAIPQAADAPPAAVTAGGQLIHLMTYEQCEPCDQGYEVITAAGGPVRPPKAWFADPHFTAGDERLVEILDRRGERVIGGKHACPLTVTDDGRVFGHLAPWGVCHTGSTGSCILAPRSNVNYAHFKRGQHVITAEGDKVPVGVITCDAGHAAMRGISASQAMAHYDNTALACADVNIGEDEYGIWIAGALRPDASEEQVRKLRAASISGDWRQLGGSLELVAALAVNQPGFPLAVVADGHQAALVAAGASVMHAVKHPPAPETPDLGDVALRRALSPLLGDAKDRARNRLAALR